MTITRADVADLRVGDVVELSGHRSLHGATVTGSVWAEVDGSLCVGDWTLRRFDGGPSSAADQLSLTVISRAKPPLYVNSDKTEPDPGDVAAAAESGPNDGQTWHFLDAIGREWFDKRGYALGRDELPDRLHLLIDGRTGQVVQ